MLHLHLVSLPVLIKCLDLRLVPDLDLDNNKYKKTEQILSTEISLFVIAFVIILT